jgi:hypothetical protein
MGDFVVSREPVPDWRTTGSTPVRPMADQIGDVLEQFDDQKDFRSIVALTQGMRAVDQRFSTDDTIDRKEWEVVRRAMRKALGDPKAPVDNRAERITKAFDEETAPKP